MLQIQSTTLIYKLKLKKNIMADIKDKDGNELTCFLNEWGKVAMSISEKNEDKVFASFVNLDIIEVDHLISLLQDLKLEMKK